MKRIIILSIILPLLSWAFPVYGQTGKPKTAWANTKIPKGSTFHIKFDYGHTLFMGFSYDEYFRKDRDFQEGLIEAEGRFVELFKELLWDNSTTKKRVFNVTDKDEADYTLVVRPLEINDHGSVDGDIVILDAAGRPVANLRNFVGSGGKYGSFTNLIGDGYESLAHEIVHEISLTIQAGTI